jgi:hypothetical protein
MDENISIDNSTSNVVSVDANGDGLSETLDLDLYPPLYFSGSGSLHSSGGFKIEVKKGDLTLGGGLTLAGIPVLVTGANAKFTLDELATITGNTVSGVYVTGGDTFTMTGGTISGNTAEKGGGVYVGIEGKFYKNRNDGNVGGTIYGNDGAGNGNSATDGDPTGGGHAVYVDRTDTILIRNTTAGMNISLSTEIPALNWVQQSPPQQPLRSRRLRSLNRQQ